MFDLSALPSVLTETIFCYLHPLDLDTLYTSKEKFYCEEVLYALKCYLKDITWQVILKEGTDNRFISATVSPKSVYEAGCELVGMHLPTGNVFKTITLQYRLDVAPLKSTTGEHLYFTDYSQSLKVLSTVTGEIISTSAWKDRVGKTQTILDFCDDRKKIIVINGCGTITCLSVSDGSIIWRLVKKAYSCQSLLNDTTLKLCRNRSCISRDTKRFYTCLNRSPIQWLACFDVMNGNLLWERNMQISIRNLNISYDDRYILVNNLFILSAMDGEVKIERPNYEVTNAEIVPTGFFDPTVSSVFSNNGSIFWASNYSDVYHFNPDNGVITALYTEFVNHKIEFSNIITFDSYIVVGTSEGNLLYFSDESPCLMKTVKLEINEDDLQTILDAERRGYVINRNKKILFLKKNW